MIRYRVKWVNDAGTHYGIYVERASYNKDVYKGVPIGMAVVDDAIKPTYHIVRDDILLDIPVGGGHDEYDRYVESEYKKADALDATLPVKTVAVGALFQIGVADGSASYVVTRVNKNTCDVEWRGFCDDRYYDHYFGAGRKGIPTEEVRRYLSGRLFGKKLVKKGA